MQTHRKRKRLEQLHLRLRARIRRGELRTERGRVQDEPVCERSHLPRPGERLQVRLCARLHLEGLLREDHLAMRTIALPERRAVRGEGERIRVQLQGELLRRSL